MIDTARSEPSSGCRVPAILYWRENWYLALREVNVGLKEMKAVTCSSQCVSCCAATAAGTGTAVFFQPKGHWKKIFIFRNYKQYSIIKR